jgi:Family of unknown function (DUF6580)
MSNRTKVLLVGIIIAALGRVVPHPPNFTPMTALALFGGAYLSRRWVAFLVPLVALLLGDCCMEAIRWAHLYGTANWLSGGRGFYATMWTTYLAFVLVVAIGCWLGSRAGVVRIALATFTSSVIFFIVTNFAVWAMENIYPRTFGGLIECYVAALPFFGNTVVSDAVFVAILFGGLALLEGAKERSRSTATATVN